MMPVGTGDVKPVLEALIEDAEALGAKFRMLGVCVGMKADLEAVMPGRSPLPKIVTISTIFICALTWLP